MKTLKFSFVTIVFTTILTLSGCTIQSGAMSYDDVYYNPNDEQQYQEVEKRANSSSNFNNENNQNYSKKSREYNEKLKNNNLTQNNQDNNQS